REDGTRAGGRVPGWVRLPVRAARHRHRERQAVRDAELHRGHDRGRAHLAHRRVRRLDDRRAAGVTMRVGVFFPTKEHGPLPEMVTRVGAIEAAGFSSAWFPQSTGRDRLTALSVVGSTVGRIELGTSVVPTYPRHPVMLAAQVLTANQATG